MEKPVLVWNGSWENQGICHEKTPETDIIKAQSNEYFDIPGRSKPETCLRASDKEFRKYGAILFDDIAILQRLIENLKSSCESWK